MKTALAFLLALSWSLTAVASESHSCGYATGLSEAALKNGKGDRVSIKVGAASDSLSHDLLKTPEKDGFTAYELYPALKHDKQKLAACTTVIRIVYVSQDQVKDFEKKFCEVRPEVARADPFGSGGNVIDIRDHGTELAGILWQVDDKWVLIIK